MNAQGIKSYYRVMLGRKSMHADECLAGNFIGADYGIEQDLSSDLGENWRDFNKQFIPVFLANRPHKSKIAAGLACGTLWTVSKGLKTGDIVLCPDGQGTYCVGVVDGDYQYVPEGVLPHRRPVQWLDRGIERSQMTGSLQNSAGSSGTICNVTQYHEELGRLIGGATTPVLFSTDQAFEDPSIFALEKHLEDFLVLNWSQTELGRDYDVFEDEGERIGQQYPTDTGPIDILAIKKDKSELLVVELKKGRASDAVVGQVLRYMGFVQEQLIDGNQAVRGLIIALDDDQRLKRALAMTQNIDFYRYEVSFKLHRA